jgi:hypothetical protein
VNINIFYLPIQVSGVYALELEPYDVAEKQQETVTKIMIKLITLQHLQGPWYTFLPHETIMLKPQSETKFRIKFLCSSVGTK